MNPIRKPYIRAFGKYFHTWRASNGTRIEWQKGSPRFDWLYRREAGNSNLTGILIIIFIIIVVITTPRNERGGPNYAPGITITGLNPGNSGTLTTGNVSGQTLTSKSQGIEYVYLGSGNAAYSYQPYEEYITIHNAGNAVDITGWQLKNGKDSRPYLVGSSLQRFSADVALIPQAAKILRPSGTSPLENVILKSNEQAIITTGAISVRSPYVITSFKENMCTGYLEDLPDYSFNPPLPRNCPQPSREPGIENLDIACRKIVERISPCETPVFGERDWNTREFCTDCYKGNLVSSMCKAFIVEHFSYQGCLITHQYDTKFEGNNWRIFLGRGWEMWAKEYESIELFDRFGQLVTFQKY